jgi:hypothetical protein
MIRFIDCRALLIGALATALAGCATDPATTRAGDVPFTYRHEVRRDPELHLHIVTIDLTDPRVRVGAHAGGPDPDGEGPWQTTLATVRDMADRGRLDIAVNANFFAAQRVVRIGGRRVPYFAGNWARAAGWLVCDGRAVSREPAEASLVVDERGHVRIGRFAQLPPDAKQVVSGSQMLLTRGKVTARGEVRAPRTAAGIDAGGATLTLLVVDGRLLSHSVGMSELELAREMLRLGCSDALNLDGGGSSTLVMRGRPEGVLRVMNRPSDGHDLAIPLSLERHVACALGVRLDGPPMPSTGPTTEKGLRE